MPRLLLLSLVLAACAPVTPASPALLAAQSAGLYTATAEAQSLAYQSTEAAIYARNQAALSTIAAATAKVAASGAEAEAQSAAATAEVVLTERAAWAIAMPTHVAATGTALARFAAIDEANARAAESRASWWLAASSLGGVVGLALSVVFIYWVAGRARADVRARHYRSGPVEVGDVLVLPPGFTSRSVIVDPIPPPQIASPKTETALIPRTINGRPSEVAILREVNETAKAWQKLALWYLRECRAEGRALKARDICGASRPFSQNDYWTILTDALDANSILLKNSTAPTLSAGEWDALIARVSSATLNWPASSPPHFRREFAQNVANKANSLTA